MRVVVGTGLGTGSSCSGEVKAASREGCLAIELTELQGKRDRKRGSRIAQPQVGSSMVRRGSTVRVRQRALQRPRKTGSFVFGPTCTYPVRSGVESVLEKRVLPRIPTRRLMERALEDRAMFDAHSEMGQRRWNALAPAPERSSDARKAYARGVGEAGRDRRASTGGRATAHEGDHEARDRVGSQFGPEGQDSRSDSCGDARRRVEAGGSFKRVDKGTYTLADDLAESATAKPKKPEAKPRPKRTSGNARKRTSRNAQTAA